MKTRLTKQAVPAIKRQLGAATLLVSVILLFAITLITIFSGRVGLLEQKTAANDYRYKEAFSAAEAGLEDGLRFVRNNGGTITTSYNQTSATKTLTNGAAYTYTVQRTATATDPITVSAAGTSSDGVGTSTVQVLAGYYGIIAGDGPDVPLISDGTATLSGTIEVIANSNAAGTSVPVSVWAHVNILYTGSGATCELDGYFRNGGITADENPDSQLCAPNTCQCEGPTMDVSISSNAGGDGPDTVDNDAYVSDGGNFPDDLFDYVFGVARADWQSVKDIAAAGYGGVFSDCSALDADSTGIYWIEGDCDIANNTQAGSLDAPVVVVVSEGNLTMRGGSSLFGLIYGFDKNDDGVIGGITINGSSIVYGSFVSDTDIDISNGSLDIRYNKSVLQLIFGDGSGDPDVLGDGFKQLARVAGTWRDF